MKLIIYFLLILLIALVSCAPTVRGSENTPFVYEEGREIPAFSGQTIYVLSKKGFLDSSNRYVGTCDLSRLNSVKDLSSEVVLESNNEVISLSLHSATARYWEDKVLLCGNYITFSVEIPANTKLSSTAKLF